MVLRRDPFVLILAVKENNRVGRSRTTLTPGSYNLRHRLPDFRVFGFCCCLLRVRSNAADKYQERQKIQRSDFHEQYEDTPTRPGVCAEMICSRGCARRKN